MFSVAVYRCQIICYLRVRHSTDFHLADVFFRFLLNSHLTQTTTWEDPRKKLLQQQIQPLSPAPPPNMVAPPLLSAVTAPVAGK